MVKLQASDKPRTITLNGVDKAAYQDEFASGAGTGTNTNHANYTGLGFVDGFDQVGDSVTFSVYADSSGDYWLRFRYANALGTAATRNVYVDGTAIGTLTLPLSPIGTVGAPPILPQRSVRASIRSRSSTMQATTCPSTWTVSL